MIENSFKILAFSDNHGVLLDHNYAIDVPSKVGLSRLATYIMSIPKKDRLLIDCGDTIQGSPMLYFHQLNRHLFKYPTALVFNEIGVDYFIPGNHDFNYGFKHLTDFMEEISASTICSNIVYKDNQKPIGLPYDIHTTDAGIRILVIGVTTDYIPNWERKDHIESVDFLSPIAALESILSSIPKTDYDFLVVSYHGGFERDIHTLKPYVEDTLENVGSRILEKFPQINLFLTGHQHRTICEKVNNTIVIQPASHGRMLADITIHFEKKDHWTIKDAQYQLIDAAQFETYKKINQILNPIDKALNKFLDIPIGIVIQNDLHIDDLFEARLNKHKIVTFINQIQLLFSSAMISATSLGNDITGFNPNITIRNVLSTYIYPNTLTVVKITGKLLKEALEKNADYFVVANDLIASNPKYSYPKQEHYNYDMFDGIHYTIKVTNPQGDKIINLKYAGKPISENDQFTLVLNNYRASGGGEFEMYRGLEIVKEINIDIAELMIQYIMKKKEIIVPAIKNIIVEK